MKQKKIIIGIDPGLTGAVAVIKSDGELYVVDTPIIEVKKGKKMKKEYLPSQMADILREYLGANCHVFLEKVHSMPKQGVSSVFGFGEGYGLWIGMIAAFRLPMTLVTPQSWKKVIMSGMSDKDAARIRAQELFPKYSNLLSRKKDIGRADAILIAEYGRRTLNK